jgi:hypothetical protein
LLAVASTPGAVMTAGHDQHSGNEKLGLDMAGRVGVPRTRRDAQSLGKRPSRTHNTGRKIRGLDDIAEIGHGVRYVRVGSAMMFPWRPCPGCAGP